MLRARLKPCGRVLRYQIFLTNREQKLQCIAQFSDLPKARLFCRAMVSLDAGHDRNLRVYDIFQKMEV